MTDRPRSRVSLGLAFVTLILSVLALLLVPPSGTLAGISDLERGVARVSSPSVVAAVALALCGVWSVLTGRDRLAGLFEVLSLLLINLAGLLTWQYGVDGLGLLWTLPATAPAALVAAQRETAWRRSEGKGPPPAA